MKLYPDVFNEYADTAGTLRTPAARRSYMWVVRQLQNQYPRQTIRQFTEAQLTAFCIGDGLAPKTVKHRRTVLRQVFEWATWKGYLTTNPAAGLKYTVTPGRHSVRRGTWLDEHEAADVLRSLPDDFRGRRDRLILLFGFLLGLRRHEISQLRWSDLSSDMRALRLRGKGQKLAELGVPPQLRSALQEWRQEAPADALAIIPTTKSVGLQDRHETVDWAHGLGPNGIYAVVKKCGIAPHDLRRSFANILEDKQLPLTDIQRAMRHSNAGTTSGYLDQNPRRARAITEGITIEL